MPKLEPRLTARAIRPLVSGLRALGKDPDPIVRACGIDLPLLDDPDAHVPMRAAITLFDAAAAETGDADIGLSLAQRAEPGSFDVSFYAMLSSPTLGAAFERLARYQRLIHDTTRVELVRDGDAATLRHLAPGGLPVPRHAAEFLVAAWVRAGRIATGVEWAPREVRFAHPAPPKVAAHQRWFQAPVRFSTGETALVVPAALLETPCTRADAGLAAVLDRYADDRLARAPRPGSLADRVRSTLLEAMEDGDLGAAAVASRVRLGTRTLHRGLAAEGTSFGALLTQLRQELAARRLADDNVSIGEIAFLLGFSELSSFHRAFKRWTGQTPAEYRAALRRPPG